MSLRNPRDPQEPDEDGWIEASEVILHAKLAAENAGGPAEQVGRILTKMASLGMLPSAARVYSEGFRSSAGGRRVYRQAEAQEEFFHRVPDKFWDPFHIEDFDDRTAFHPRQNWKDGSFSAIFVLKATKNEPLSLEGAPEVIGYEYDYGEEEVLVSARAAGVIFYLPAVSDILKFMPDFERILSRQWHIDACREKYRNISPRTPLPFQNPEAGFWTSGLLPPPERVVLLPANPAKNHGGPIAKLTITLLAVDPKEFERFTVASAIEELKAFYKETGQAPPHADNLKKFASGALQQVRRHRQGVD